MSTERKKTPIPAQLVKSLRERTGAGFGDCRAALVESNGDLEAAISILRKRGQAAAAKKAQRAASQGAIGSYIHAGGRICVLVEVNCESDFVARTEDFQILCHDRAMHVAAQDPRFVRCEENCLYEQHFIKDETITVRELIEQMVTKVGENISVRRYSRFKVGAPSGA